MSGRDIGFLAGGATVGGFLVGVFEYLLSGRHVSRDRYDELMVKIADGVFYGGVGMHSVYSLSLFFWLIDDETSDITYDLVDGGEEGLKFSFGVKIRGDASCGFFSELSKQGRMRRVSDHYSVMLERSDKKPEFFDEFNFVVKLVGDKSCLTFNGERVKEKPFLVAEGTSDKKRNFGFMVFALRMIVVFLASALSCGEFVSLLGMIFAHQGGIRHWLDG